MVSRVDNYHSFAHGRIINRLVTPPILSVERSAILLTVKRRPVTLSLKLDRVIFLLKNDSYYTN